MGRSKQLRVGLIGTGFMGQMHISGLRQIERRKLLPASLAAITGLNKTKAQRLAKKLGCRFIPSGEELIADPEIDVIVIATPTDSHKHFVERACEAGKPIFLEKPMGRNLAEAEEVARLIKNSGVPHQVGLVLRFSPTYNVLKKLISDKANGRLVFCHFRDDQFFPIGSVYDSDWRQRVERCGGGTLIEHSIHDVDVLQWFFGEPKLTNAIIQPSEVRGIEEVAALNMTFPGGGSAQLSSVWHRNLTRENERRIEIFYENRFFHTLGGFVSPIEVQGPRGKTKTIDSKEIQRRFRAMIGWRDAKNAAFPSTIGYEMYVFLKGLLKGQKESAISVDEGLAAHRLIESAYRMGRAS